MRRSPVRTVHIVLLLLTSPLLILFLLSTKQNIILDIKRWSKILKLTSDSNVINLLVLLSRYKEFRNLFYYRVRTGNPSAKILMHFFKIFYKELPTLGIWTDSIGPGLFIQHGVCTIIAADSIGKNCSINQQVTIGYSDDVNRPTIGDNVRITAGAKVIGGVKIGDNVTVGANAVVLKDVPNNCVVVGVPARIVSKDGVRVDQQL